MALHLWGGGGGGHSSLGGRARLGREKLHLGSGRGNPSVSSPLYQTLVDSFLVDRLS